MIGRSLLTLIMRLLSSQLIFASHLRDLTSSFGHGLGNFDRVNLPYGGKYSHRSRDKALPLPEWLKAWWKPNWPNQRQRMDSATHAHWSQSQRNDELFCKSVPPKARVLSLTNKGYNQKTFIGCSQVLVCYLSLSHCERMEIEPPCGNQTLAAQQWLGPFFGA